MTTRVTNGLLLLSAVFIAGPVIGQSARAARPLANLYSNADSFLTASGDLVQVSVNETGKVELEVGGSVSAFQSGVNVPGDFFPVNESNMLVAGRTTTGSGIIEHWIFGSGSWTLLSSLTLSGKDVCGITYTGGNLYVLDSVGKSILKGAWTTSQALTTVSLATWASVTTVPELSQAESQLLMTRDVLGTGEVLLADYPVSDHPKGQLVTESGGTVSGTGYHQDLGLEGYLLMFPTAEVYVLIDAHTMTESGTAVTVIAPAGHNVEVIKLEDEADTETVLGTAVVATGQSSVVVTLSQALVIGTTYAARRVGYSGIEGGIKCVRRYGFGEVFTDGTLIETMMPHESACVGNADFFVSVQLTNLTIGADKTVSGLMGVGVRSPLGVDPIIPIGSNFLLVTTSYLPALGYVATGVGSGWARADMAIPNDPSLIGDVFLVQFGLTDGSNVRLSEIQGIQVAASESSSTAQGGPTSLRGTRWHELLKADGAVFDNSLVKRIIQSRH